MESHKSHVPNHQPYIYIYFSSHALKRLRCDGADRIRWPEKMALSHHGQMWPSKWLSHISIHLVTNSDGGSVSLHSMLANSVQKLNAIARHKAGGYSLSGAVLYCPEESLPIDAPCGRCGVSLLQCRFFSRVGKPRTKNVVGFAVGASKQSLGKRNQTHVRQIKDHSQNRQTPNANQLRVFWVFWMLKESSTCTHCQGCKAFKSKPKEK